MATRTGPQKYPGASTSYWYQDNYPGDAMETNTVVLHTTEGRSLPGYDGGALAPNLTAVPDFGAKQLRWYQHFDIDTSSRALRNLAGGVETNTLNVCQVELVGTCAPATHTAWGSSPHIYWPQAPDWALAEVAEFLAWMHDNHNVPLTGPTKWPAYPASYGTDNGARMSNAAWTGFSGVCGHMHVPENLHGDPGAIDFSRIIALANGDGTVALTADDIEKIARKVLTLDEITAPKDAPDVATNPTWRLDSYVKDIDARVRAVQTTLASPQPAVLTDAQVQALANSPTLAENIAELVAVKLAARLAS